jgi:Fe-S cluster assembly ATP-binding protein
LISAANGSGKSSFLKALAGFEGYSLSGSFGLKKDTQDIDLQTCTIDERARLGLWLVSQELPAVPGLTIIQFLRELVKLYKLNLNTKDLLLKVKECQNRLGLEPDFYTKEVHHGLSGGQQKRLEMLQLLLIKPQYILIDEIDSGLDQAGKEIFSRLLESEFGESLQIIVSHNQDFCDLFNFDKKLTIKNQQILEL